MLTTIIAIVGALGVYFLIVGDKKPGQKLNKFEMALGCLVIGLPVLLVLGGIVAVIAYVLGFAVTTLTELAVVSPGAFAIVIWFAFIAPRKTTKAS